MANVIVLAKDDRVRRQVEIFLNELGMEDLRFATFRTQQEFQELYFRERQNEPAEETPKPEEEEGGAELKLFSELNVLIFALDSITGKPGEFIDNTRLNLKKFKHMPEGGELRTVLLKYEDDGINKVDVLHPFLDDLIYLPIDRLIFLQKLQILINLPKRISPTFLFNQEVQMGIEISKIVKMDRLSDVALAIRNPVPLRAGLPGHFYLLLPSEKERLEINAKVLHSEPHPEYPGQYLVYFSYFGLNKKALSTIRRSLSKSAQYKGLIFDDREKFKFRPDDLFLNERDRHVFGVVVIDTDEAAGNSLAQMLSKEMDRLNVARESSYSLFLHRYLEAGGVNKDTTPPRATEVTDFYANPITLTVSTSNLNCLSVEPGPDESATFLGHPAAAIFSSADRWLSMIQDPESRLIIEEAVQLVRRGREVNKLLALQDAQNQRCAANFRITKGSVEDTVAIKLTPASLNDIFEKLSSDQKSKDVEALVVDASFVPSDAASWVEGLRLRATQVGLVADPKMLKFWLVSDNENADPSWLNLPEFLGLMIKPIDQRQMLFSFSEHLPNKNTIYNFENLGWTSPALSIHVSRDIELEALSEYGATLKSKQKIAPGNVLYLRKSIYDQAPNGCLSARVYACEEHPSDKEFFQIYVTYFGINDTFLKFARTWIRENYAQQKNQANG